MTSIALIVGNASYDALQDLDCCLSDVEAVDQLLAATGRYDIVRKIVNATSDDLKSSIRSAISAAPDAKEIFFYFSGHGHQIESDFFFCATNFDSKRPNETGLSHTDLHELLKSTSPDLVIKVVDACNSGSLLIKSDHGFLPVPKSGYKHLIQISSCLDSQNSLTGDPLSEFTEKFVHATIRKLEGPVYYTDIMSTLRDEFLGNNSQTPHFVSQGTGREVFVDDAKRMDDFRATFQEDWSSEKPVKVEPVNDTTPEPPSLMALLEDAESKIAKPDDIKSFVDALFDGLRKEFSTEQFADFFDLDVLEHSDFEESNPKGFMIKVLSKESRPDKFVTSEITKTKKKKNRFDYLSAALATFYDDDDYVEHWDLQLNCKMERAQLKISLVPKFTTLQKLVLIVTCAPSLEHCYVFELATRHPRTDWQDFDPEGSEVVRRWYKRSWAENVDWLVAKIAEQLKSVIQTHIEATADRLSKKE